MQTAEQTSRPDRHPALCGCDACRTWQTAREARVAGYRPVQHEPTLTTLNERVDRIDDCTRSTHRWVVVIGWIVIVQAILGILGGAYLWGHYTEERKQTNARIGCVQASSFQTLADCFN